MGKLWEKDYKLDSYIEDFTVGVDYVLDQNLVRSDCISSLAHSKMLLSIGILSNEESASLEKGLIDIIKDSLKGEFTITQADEDCHTAIENRLIKTAGAAGEKIHTGRSRNDQILAALRVYSRAYIIECMNSALHLVKSFIKLAQDNKNTPMPGRTHMQIAMPSSVGLWAGAFAEELLDDIRLLWSVYDINNQCPLGSAASYGVPIPLNREMVSDLLGFKKVQNNVLYVNNSRGKIESFILDALDHIGISLSKAAQDLIIFTMPEFGYFSLPSELCSGSSIMPQKKNPDALELIRAKSATLTSYAFQIKGIIRSLPSGYNRDFQETKEPFLRGTDLAVRCISVMNLTIDKLEINKEKLKKGFVPEIFATDAALDLVLKGESFRTAYKETGLNLKNLKHKDPLKIIESRNYTGTTGNLRLDIIQEEVLFIQDQVDTEAIRVNKKITDLAGFSVKLI